MNRKGALFHLIILGAFLALGIFVTFFISPQLRHYVPGAWQQQFLQQGYFPAEAALLELEVKAREIGEEAVAELAAGGGFINDSPCGVVEGVQLWNKGDQWCTKYMYNIDNTRSIYNFLEEIPKAKIENAPDWDFSVTKTTTSFTVSAVRKSGLAYEGENITLNSDGDFGYSNTATDMKKIWK